MVKTLNLLEVQIETPRLVLQPVTEAWAPEICAGFDHDVSQYMHGLPDRSISQTLETIQQSREQMAQGRSLHLVAVDKQQGEFLGKISLYDIPSRHPEFGIWIKKEAHLQWYGRECVHNLLEWSVKHLAVDYFIYPVDKRNIASLKIPEFFNGRIERMYEVQTESGRQLHILEYHIPITFK
jgi:RimJ/RimL family protein N-acetyltransferase